MHVAPAKANRDRWTERLTDRQRTKLLYVALTKLALQKLTQATMTRLGAHATISIGDLPVFILYKYMKYEVCSLKMVIALHQSVDELFDD